MVQIGSARMVQSYLENQGQDSSFSARKKLFSDKGLSDRLGDFIGTPAQNNALLKSLKQSQNAATIENPTAQEAVQTTASNVASFISGGGSPPDTFGSSRSEQTGPDLSRGRERSAAIGDFFSNIFNPQGEAPTANELPSAFGDGFSATNIGGFSVPDIGIGDIPVPGIPGREEPTAGGQQPAQDPFSGTSFSFDALDRIMENISQQAQIASSEGSGQQISEPSDNSNLFTTPSGAVVDAGTGNLVSMPDGSDPEEVTEEVHNAVTKANVGFSASDMIPSVSTSESSLINQYLNSPEGQIEIERAQLKGLTLSGAAEATKNALEQKYQQEAQKVESTLASKGLFFSGVRTTQIKALADSLASSKLEVDRKLASKLLDADIDLRENILEGVSSLIEDAQNDREEAIEQLNKAGLAVVGDQIVPTLSAQKEQRITSTPELNIQVDEQGTVTALDKSTGQVVWQTAGVGRTGQSSPNISVSPVADPATGTAQHTQIIDRDTGQIRYIDNDTGEEVDPSQVQIKEGQDEWDQIINSFAAELANSIEIDL